MTLLFRFGVVGIVVLTFFDHIEGLDNGVGVTPPMGFNPWNCFGISAKGTCKLPLPWHGVCVFEFHTSQP